MKPKVSTEEAVARLLKVQAVHQASPRERYLYREALYALVRLAKAELMMEMKNNVRKLTALPLRRREKARQRADAQRQQQFEFGQER